jgi:hypothetical protein
METGSPAGVHSATAPGDTGVLDIDEEDFANLLDVPYVTVNRIGTQYEGEVIMSGDPIIDEARIEQALDVGRAHGVHAYARKHGGDSVLLFFTANTEPPE